MSISKFLYCVKNCIQYIRKANLKKKFFFLYVSYYGDQVFLIKESGKGKFDDRYTELFKI